MAVIVETIYGRKLSGQYHLDVSYHNREEIEAPLPADYARYAIGQITKIQDETLVTTEANVLLNEIKSGLSAEVLNIENINKLFGLLSYLGFELYFILRSDLEQFVAVEPLNRAYCLYKNVLASEGNLPALNNFQIGIVNAFEAEDFITIADMTISFLDQDKISLGSAELAGLAGIPTVLAQYRTLDRSRETNLMDTTAIRAALEQIGFRFFIEVNTEASI